MKRLRLVVTGDAEKAALGASLARVLNESGDVVELEKPMKVGSITSTPLPDLADSRTPTPVSALANALVTETMNSRDLVVGVDDLELANIADPARVISWIRRGIEERIAAESNRVRAALRERCSFHLLVPMVEAYFFGEASALVRAGMDAAEHVQTSGADVEAFATPDATFLQEMLALGVDRSRTPWWRDDRHPKRYLEHLVGRGGGIYRETGRERGGIAALQTLDWHAVVAPSGALFARALFDDLADALLIANPLAPLSVNAPTYPSKTTKSSTLLLRNV